MNILTVFLVCLEDDPACSTRLLLVNRASGQWLIPFVYHSISFTTAKKLVTFHKVHDVPEERLSQRFNLIYNLYIGAAPEDWSETRPTRSRGDLLYASNVWPLTTLCRIFWMCGNLQNLALLYLDQNEWQRLEYAIPASLKKLVLGPIHGSFHPSDLRKRPRLEHFTSAECYMRDDEVLDVVTFPSLKTFRRMSNSLNGAVIFSTEKVECLSRSTTLEKYEIVVCNTKRLSIPVRTFIKALVQRKTDDPRICVKSMPDCRWGSIVYEEYCEFRRQHFSKFSSNLLCLEPYLKSRTKGSRV